jgi:hypothetical protein
MQLTPADIQKAADILGVAPSIVKAVIEVESGGSGFNPDGTAKIQFEGHIFYRELKRRGINPADYQAGNEDIIYPSFTSRFVLGQKAEYKQLAKALDICREAALLSTSWGLFQIMGFNYPSCGFRNVEDFVEAHKESEAKQLEAFCVFLRTNGLIFHLVKQDWATFARRYNGPAFEVNKYDQKLKKAYEKFKTAQS